MGTITESAATSAFSVSMLSDGGQSIRITSKLSRIGFSALRSLNSRPAIMVRSRTSAAVRSWLAGMSMKPPYSTGTSASKAPQSPSSTSQLVRAWAFFSMPQPMVALP